MTENEFMREMIKAAGGDPDKLPDRLKSTYYQCLIDCMNSGGGSGGSGGSGGNSSPLMIGFDPVNSDGDIGRYGEMYNPNMHGDADWYEFAKKLLKSENVSLFTNVLLLNISDSSLSVCVKIQPVYDFGNGEPDIKGAYLEFYEHMERVYINFIKNTIGREGSSIAGDKEVTEN